ncbi:capsular polysaccharide biosynthesis protein CpsA [Streptococcus varani]|uniref:Capsular polysaccharide biosynthesis protein CpsA n=1 Tax=Streptococcus varani TaxID=1608583 RepID=A0A0E4CSG9_9STRE|nr:LCP family protein [Streptococcus varani]CQR24530.1 capsular polysaccharide biosynthesis protein CpsA [Streptococcus varani]
MSRHLRTSSKGKKVSSTWLLINSAFLALYTALAGFFIYKMYAHHFLAFRNINHIVAGILIAIFVFSVVLIILKKAKFFTTFTLVLFTLFTSAGLYFVQSTVQVAEKLNKTASYSEIEMSVVVPAGSDIQDISQLGQLQAPVNNDSENIQALLSDLKVQKNLDLVPEPVDSYQHAYENLLSGGTQGMVLNSAYSSLLELSDADYASKIRTLYTYKITKEVKPSVSENKKDEHTNPNVVNIYISGIDTYGNISTVSRSDVNIIMTVNMDTHKVMLTTTPRDAYVQIPDGGANQFDKLTHAGIYGVETSMKTLENLYDINIDYYARINFTSFMQLIDVLGGVEVYNDQAFVSRVGGYEFPQGPITLNSQQALGFVRERYSLQGGDADRGRNQQKVISAIINKLASVDSITNFSTIINSLQNSVQTNMPLESMMRLANTQLASGSSFTVVSQDVTGTGSTGQLPSYAMPSAALYMMSLDETSISAAKQAIRNTMEGN